jgi:hypothetical protein
MAGLFALFAGAIPAAAQPAMEPLDHAICRLIEAAAQNNHLPVSFLTRVIWRESSFHPGAVSPVGAMGIAQFMPGTAQERGLANPFDPEEAIPKAAHFLAELRQQFGSLGNAAAAYNAGPARVASWLRGEGDLPTVTYSYMRFVTEADPPPPAPTGKAITGKPATNKPGKPTANNDDIGTIQAAEEERAAPDIVAAAAAASSCVGIVAELRHDSGTDDDDTFFAPLSPWGVQLAGNFSKSRALASFERARRRYARVVGDATPMVIGRLLRSRGTRRFYQVRLPAASRQAAESLCARIQSVGGNCVAMRS